MKGQRLIVGVAGFVFAAAALAAPDGDASAKTVYLRNMLAFFQSLSAERQEQIRQLDRELNELDPVERARLTKALERYAAWVERLPEKDRVKITAPSSKDVRLVAIREAKLLEWLDNLPKAMRDQYKAAKADEKPKLIERWKDEEHVRKGQWQFVVDNWSKVTSPNQPEFMKGSVADISNYARNLATQSTDSDRARIKALQEALDAHDYPKIWNEWAYLQKQSARKTLIPGPLDGPKWIDELPPKIQDYLKDSPAWKAKANYPADLVNAKGKWPDFALAMARTATRLKLELPVPIVQATRKLEMPIEVQVFIARELEALAKSDPTRAKAMEALKASEGKWPDYPEAVMKAARDLGLDIPGWTPPSRLLNIKKKNKN